MASSAMLQPLHAETYTIKKINTPTIRINDKDMKVGDKFTDGSVVYWSSGSQAMRVLNSHNEPINLRAAGNTKPARMRTLVSSLSKLSTRAICTSLADHKQAFEGINGEPQELLDTITIASSWGLDDNNYFEMSVPTATGKRIVRLPYTDNGELIIARSMFPMAQDDKEVEVTAEISYHNGRKGETRLITSAMRINLLPSLLPTSTDPE